MLIEVVASVAVFTVVILGLTVLLLVARRYLVPQGAVEILVNDDPDKVLTVNPGVTLLTALSSNGVLLPSACGGGGTCAMCKCQVLEGGGDPLPTEVGHLSRSEQKTGWRLGCQVKVKSDMKVQVPAEIFGIKKFQCKVRSNNGVATFIKELDLEIVDGQTLKFKAGDYIQIDIPEYRHSYKEFDIEEEYRPDWDKYDLWRFNAWNDEPACRAYSMANHPAEGQRVMLNVRVASPPPRLPDVQPGISSSFIFNLKPGDDVTVSGPYGHFHIADTKREMIYIGGGAGMAPLRGQLFHLFHTEKTRDRKISYWYGARSLREVFYDHEFDAIQEEYDNFKWHLALSDALPEDNWKGYTGFIHNVLLENYLKDHDAPEDCEFYICGPPMMLSAVRKMLDDLGVPSDQVLFDDFGG